MYPVPKKSLARFLADSNVEETNVPLSRLATLKDTKHVALAFDGVKLLENITQTVRDVAPVAVYTSSTPLCVYNCIDEVHMLAFRLGKYFSEKRDFSFKPVFVFDGCKFQPMPSVNATPPPPIHQAIASKSASRGIRMSGVATLDDDILRDCAERFNLEVDVDSLIVRRIRDLFPDTFRAPYLAWSQISAFFAESNNYVSDVYGSLELLAFPGIERVITKIDVEKSTFDCITKAAALKAIRARCPWFTEEDFGAVLLLECKQKAFSVPLPPNFSAVFSDFCRMPTEPNRSCTQRYLSSPSITAEMRSAFVRNLAALEAPVMTVSAKCVTLNKLYGRQKSWNTLAAFGRPAPSVLYYFLFTGMPMAAPFAALSQACFEDDWPLIDSAFYRGACESVLPLFVQTSFQLFQFAGLSGSAQLRWLRQFMVQRGARTPNFCWSTIQNPPEIDLCNWSFRTENLLQHEGGTVYFSDVVPFAECAVSERIVAPDLQSTLATILLKSLDLIGYFTHFAVDGPDQSGACGFSYGLQHFDCPTLSEYGVLIIEMVRTKTLVDDPIAVVASNSPAPGMYEVPRGVRFAARALSIIPINLDSQWTGAFDPEMAAFGTASRLLGRTLRLMTEVITAMVFASGGTALQLWEYDEVIRRLPFQIPIEFNAGFLMMYILMNPRCTLESVKQNFPDLSNFEDDLFTLFWFWSMTYRALTIVLEVEQAEPPLLDIPMLMDAHKAVAEACLRLMPNAYAMYYENLRVFTDALENLHQTYYANLMIKREEEAKRQMREMLQMQQQQQQQQQHPYYNRGN